MARPQGEESGITERKSPQSPFASKKKNKVGERGGVVNGRTKSSCRNKNRRAVESRKRLVRAYVASDIGAGAGRRVGALVRSLVS